MSDAQRFHTKTNLTINLFAFRMAESNGEAISSSTVSTGCSGQEIH